MPELAKIIQSNIKDAERQLEYEPSLKLIEQIPLLGQALTVVLDTFSGDESPNPHSFNLMA
jgi:hypothetical protein